MIELNKVFETKTDKIVQGGLGAFVVIGCVIQFGFLSESGLTEADLLSGSYYALFDERYLEGKDLALDVTCEEMLEAAKEANTSDFRVGVYQVFEVSENTASEHYGVKFTFNDCRETLIAEQGDDYGSCSSDSWNERLPTFPVLEWSSAGLPSVAAGNDGNFTFKYTNIDDGFVNVEFIGIDGNPRSRLRRACVQP